MKISIRHFTPLTAKKGAKTTERKEKLRDEFLEQNPSLKKRKKPLRINRFKIKSVFYLFENTTDKTGLKKDLDNLLKILLDVLPEVMDDNKKNPGLKIIPENRDELFFEVHARKKVVSSHEKEGIDVEITSLKKN